MSDFEYRHNALWVENVPVADIVKEVGTPCYIYSHAGLIRQWTAFNVSLGNRPHKVCYAVKANSNLAVLNALAQCGSGFDIVSGGELMRVIAAGGSPDKIVFSGVGKQPFEIIAALKKDIFCFNVESEAELSLINQLANHLNVKARIALRVNPDVDSQSHPYISTGLKESKFGIDIEQAPLIFQKALKLDHVHVKGVACHIGSQLTSLNPFLDAGLRLNTLINHLESLGIFLQHVDIGGGLGVHYHDEKPPTPAQYGEAILSLPFDPSLEIIIEPGRAIAADAGILATTVLLIKNSGNKQFCIVDCAMNDLMRPTLYTAWQEIIPIQKVDEPLPQIYDVVGPVCESGDFLGKDRSLSILAGDRLAICNAGAYGFVMSSNYNTRPRAAEVMVKGAEFKIIRQRETVEELFAKESVW